MASRIMCRAVARQGRMRMKPDCKLPMPLYVFGTMELSSTAATCVGSWNRWLRSPGRAEGGFQRHVSSSQKASSS